jgi:hypothetical protein
MKKIFIIVLLMAACNNNADTFKEKIQGDMVCINYRQLPSESVLDGGDFVMSTIYPKYLIGADKVIRTIKNVSIKSDGSATISFNESPNIWHIRFFDENIAVLNIVKNNEIASIYTVRFYNYRRSL